MCPTSPPWGTQRLFWVSHARGTLPGCTGLIFNTVGTILIHLGQFETQHPKINSPNVTNPKMNSQNTQNPKINLPDVRQPENEFTKYPTSENEFARCPESDN